MPPQPSPAIKFLVNQKPLNSQIFHLEKEFIANNEIDPPYSESQADVDSLEYFNNLIANPLGGLREYERLKCIQLNWETRGL